ncbi:MAG: glutamine-hydrolyzing carbamoyl-phosphate synthase small subunit [Candidatus Marinimicrobia bacterium]|nr:glutamine-hydrolyzing carbamoyl-phosphate synthase small subunit [Candidatus Neomarinimicrobiota bacterium]
MTHPELSPATLLLANGARFDGLSFGALGSATGEVCFNTGMTGYQEILTDPSYAGQLVTMTYPHIGNYGVNDEDVESSRIQVAGFIVRDGTATPSNHRMTQTLPDYLTDAGIVGIQGIDTRMLVRMIRSEGAMNGVIASGEIDEAALKRLLGDAPNMTGLDLASAVTCSKPYTWGDGAGKFRVVAYDFGIKYNIMRKLENLGCAVTVVPANTPAKEALALRPDGIILSNGPGDPAAVTPAIEAVGDLLGQLPMFGICLGHQILALALGATTYKLPFGHRGINHPVKNLATGKVEITSQNHGFAVDADSIKGELELTHVNLNDDTVEGLRAEGQRAFSVQYHPEASPGPHDAAYLFEEFVGMMGG